MYYAILGTGIALAIAFMIVRVKKGGLPALVLKTAASVFFVFCAVEAIYKSGGETYAYGLIIICGLVCGLLGDVFLDQKWIYAQHSDTYLYWGFSCFGAGHLLFIFCLLRHFEISTVAAAIAVGAAAIVAVAVNFSGGLTGIKMGKFRLICGAYSFIILLFAGMAFAAFFSDPAQTAALVLGIGGLLFTVSDLVLSFSYFKKDSPFLVVVNHTTYYAAQYIIASSVLFFK